jgi:hypothetical protein
MTRTFEPRPGEPLAATIARAIGWSLSASTAAAAASRSSRLIPGAVITLVTTAWRSVSVPVLSNTTVSTRERRSRASPLRTKIPSAEALPQPTIIAIGAASPIAHGQATSSTDRALSTAVSWLPLANHHTANVPAANSSTAGTNTRLTRSASRCSGALSRWASSTRCCRRVSTDSEARVSTRTTSAPEPFRVPPVTWLPGPRSTGKGSPVSIDSSTADHP